MHLTSLWPANAALARLIVLVMAVIQLSLCMVVLPRVVLASEILFEEIRWMGNDVRTNYRLPSGDISGQRTMAALEPCTLQKAAHVCVAVDSQRIIRGQDGATFVAIKGMKD